jgi:hypothetical protein
MAKRLVHEVVKKFFNDNNCTLLSKEVSSEAKLDYICACGNKYSHRYREFKMGRRCPKCSIKKRYGCRANKDYKKISQVYDKLMSRLIKAQYSNNLSSESMLGYNKMDLYNHIKSFDNIPENYEVDHIFPIKAFKDHGVDLIKYAHIVNSKENLRPLCKKENNQKSDNYNLQDFINYLKKYKITPTQNPYGIEFLQY